MPADFCLAGQKILSSIQTRRDAKGEFKNFEECNKAMVHFKDEFKPNMQNHKIYKNLFNKVYKDIYPQLRPLYLKLYEIVNEEINEI